MAEMERLRRWWTVAAVSLFDGVLTTMLVSAVSVNGGNFCASNLRCVYGNNHASEWKGRTIPHHRRVLTTIHLSKSIIFLRVLRPLEVRPREVLP